MRSKAPLDARKEVALGSDILKGRWIAGGARWRFFKYIFASGLLAGILEIMPVQAVEVLQQVKTVIMIGFENHNFKQPNPTSNPQQIFTNPAAPYINSLITPGNSNATYVSYCTRYFNTGNGVHPSEPNYIWEEAGSNLGILADNDPSTANGNIFTVQHFVHQLDAASISWRNYEEDVEYTTPIVSKSGTRPNGTNAYNGSTQYSYACKHNPMCFWTNSWEENVISLTNFLSDLDNGRLAQYNWLMPDLENCMHTATTANFTYHGTTYTGGSDQCAISEGDNFLSILIPKIMASATFTNNGLIIIRFDETEGGDTTNYSIPEIIISPLAKGNAYASSVVMSHSSDVKTMEEIFGLNYTNSSKANYMSNAIPSGETAATPTGAYNNIGGTTADDLSDLLQNVPEMGVQLSAITLTNGGSAPAFGTVNIGTSATNTFAVTNSGSATLILSNVVAAGDFTVAGITLPASVIAGDSATFNVVFSPTAGGARSALLQITNNDPIYNPFTLSLAGTGNIVPPVIVASQTQMGANGFQLAFSGPLNQAYQVLASDKLAAPLTNWIIIGVGMFDGTNVSLIDGDATNYPDRFYIIESP